MICVSIAFLFCCQKSSIGHQLQFSGSNESNVDCFSQSQSGMDACCRPLFQSHSSSDVMSILAAQMANITRPCTEPLTECGIHCAAAQSMERVLQRTVGLEHRILSTLLTARIPMPSLEAWSKSASHLEHGLHVAGCLHVLDRQLCLLWSLLGPCQKPCRCVVCIMSERLSLLLCHG